ncbi:MAG: hypothetical protein EOR78_34665 [Mesorhizobium sp.]|nr:MAG: hypothetical protein EOQ85_17645 [Mesorhizobium sp.]RWM45164.1 MAG: hypothetical protein EOR78_34665 [Mesorhizobium sp.]
MGDTPVSARCSTLAALQYQVPQRNVCRHRLSLLALADSPALGHSAPRDATDGDQGVGAHKDGGFLMPLLQCDRTVAA